MNARKPRPAVRVGKLVPLVDVLPNMRSKVLCRCDCGREKEIPARALAHGTTRSCGCLTSTDRRIDHSGKHYGHWLVMGYVGRRAASGRHSVYECRCSCGKTALVLRDSLVNGRSRSCGYCHAKLGGSPRPIMAYRDQRQRAAERGVPWEFTFESWWRVWDESGKWPLRGRGGDRYAMARFGDTGPYAPDNVKIITNIENTLEYHTHRRAKEQERFANEHHCTQRLA